MQLKKPAEDIEDESGDWIGDDDVKAYWRAWRNIRTIQPPPEPKEDDE